MRFARQVGDERLMPSTTPATLALDHEIVQYVDRRPARRAHVRVRVGIVPKRQLMHPRIQCMP